MEDFREYLFRQVSASQPLVYHPPQNSGHSQKGLFAEFCWIEPKSVAAVFSVQPKQDRKGREEDFRVQTKGNPLRIFAVVMSFLHGIVGAVHFNDGKRAKSWLHFKARRIIRFPRQIKGHFMLFLLLRPWANEAHLAGEDIEKLGKLV